MEIAIKCKYTELVDINSLKPWPNNPNQHSAAQIEELAHLIQGHGWRLPIIVSTLSGCVVAGHGRMAAAKLLDMRHVPIDRQDFESPELEYAFVVSENAISEWAAIDRAMVNEALPDLGPDFDISLLGLENFTLDVAEHDSGTEEKPKEEDGAEEVEEPEKLFGQIQIFNGDSALVLKNLADNSLDAVVTDPPYGFAFMGKKWDYELPSPQLWAEVFRVLKPGGHVLAFGGPRTYHRLAVGVEDAGFEIRDQLQWLFGSGFPKSLDISKAIDKAAGHWRGQAGELISENGSMSAGNYERSDKGEAVTPDAVEWSGWGTALKPANEPIVLARKPLSEKTVAANILRWGCGGLNIDGTRIAGNIPVVPQPAFNTTGEIYNMKTGEGRNGELSRASGRFPANLILDEEAARLLDLQTEGVVHSAGKQREPGEADQKNDGGLFGVGNHDGNGKRFGDTGGASRFFYVAKASKSERNEHCGELLTWENVDQKLLASALEHARAMSDATIMAVSKWSIESFGLNTLEKSQRDLMFTIETALKMTTELKISKSSQSLSTKESILGALRTIEENGLSLVESVECLSQSEPNTTNEETELARGAVVALLRTLLPIREAAKQSNVHSTVKPVSLMRYLCRLIVPPGGLILDPFMGSGSTGVGALKENFKFIGIEREPEYFEICKKRLNHSVNQTNLIQP